MTIPKFRYDTQHVRDKLAKFTKRMMSKDPRSWFKKLVDRYDYLYLTDKQFERRSDLILTIIACAFIGISLVTIYFIAFG